MPIPFLAVISGAVAAATSFAGYLWGRDVWQWLTGTQAPDEALRCARILVVGPTGVGKTTLIRRVVGADVGVVGEGVPKTPGIEWLGSGDFPVWFADSKGLEVVRGGRQVDDIDKKLRRWPEHSRPHLAWLCMRADSARIADSTESNSDRMRGAEGDLDHILRESDVPFLVVITQADVAGPERATMTARAREVFPSAAGVVAVCAEPRTDGGRELISRHGLDALRERTLKLLPDKERQMVEAGWKVTES
jgi:predicted GTPase